MADENELEILRQAREAGGVILLLDFVDGNGEAWEAAAVAGHAYYKGTDEERASVPLSETQDMGLRLTNFRVVTP